MKLETRLTLLFGSLLVVFLGVLVALHAGQRRSAHALQHTIAAEKTRQLQQLVAIDGGTLERFASDYTQWDEMCTFVTTRDPSWAEINLDQSLNSWKFHGAWVFDAAGHEIYRRLRAPFGADELADFPSAALLDQLRRGDALHFFLRSPHGLLELRAASIHPSDDTRRNDPPHGWLVVARLWDQAVLDQLGSLTASSVEFAPTAASDREGITVALPLPDWTGAPLGYLHLTHSSALLAQMIESDNEEVVLFLAFGLALLGSAAWCVHYWIRQPLRLIERSLASDNPALADPLQQHAEEFARLAKLIHTAAAQRLSLRAEIAERTRAEHELRRALVERAALGRDLHDGVIQSIYAIGMTLQGVGPLVGPVAPEAQQRIATCVAGLNRTIGELRSYIAGLEAAASPPTSLTAGLRQLLDEIRPARPVEYSVQLDPALAPQLAPESVVQLLFIAREAISNALRHGQARRITLRLALVDGEPVFSIEDDGIGFDPAALDRRGHGLDNMTRRAEEIGAALAWEPVPTRGTRVRVELPRSAFPAPSAS